MKKTMCKFGNILLELIEKHVPSIAISSQSAKPWHLRSLKAFVKKKNNDYNVVFEQPKNVKKNTHRAEFWDRYNECAIEYKGTLGQHKRILNQETRPFLLYSITYANLASYLSCSAFPTYTY